MIKAVEAMLESGERGFGLLFVVEENKPYYVQVWPQADTAGSFFALVPVARRGRQPGHPYV